MAILRKVIVTLAFFIRLIVISPARWIFSRFIDLILPNKFVVTRVDLHIDGLPRRFDGAKLIHLTDIHYNGNSVKLVADKLLTDLVDFINNEPNVSLLLLTGDYVQRQTEPIEELCTRWLSRMKPVQEGRAYACLGNHDCTSHAGKETIARTLEGIGIPVLQNQFIMPFASEAGHRNTSNLFAPTASTSNYKIQLSDQQHRDHGFIVVGLGDLWAGDFHPDKVMNEVASLEETKWRNQDQQSPMNSTTSDSDELPVVVALSHNPDTASRLSKWRMTLQLSGHTHGGQICVPVTGRPLLEYLAKMPYLIRMFVPNGFLKCVKKWEWGKGLYRILADNPTSPAQSRLAQQHFFLYTGSGLASHAGLRIFCPPEVTVFTLIRNGH